MFPSNNCEYTAKKNEPLKKHVSSEHEGERYACDFCEHKSTDKAALN